MPFYQLKVVWGLSALTSSTNKAFFFSFLFLNCQSLDFFFHFWIILYKAERYVCEGKIPVEQQFVK